MASRSAAVGGGADVLEVAAAVDAVVAVVFDGGAPRDRAAKSDGRDFSVFSKTCFWSWRVFGMVLSSSDGVGDSEVLFLLLLLFFFFPCSALGKEAFQTRFDTALSGLDGFDLAHKSLFLGDPLFSGLLVGLGRQFGDPLFGGLDFLIRQHFGCCHGV